MFQPDRHEPLVETPWNEGEARRAIREIASSALIRFDFENLWPSHTLDEGVPDGVAGVYMGATGVISALDYLKRAGVIDYAQDFSRAMPGIVERDNAWLKNFPLGKHGSLLMGDLGTHLVAMRLAPNEQTTDRVFARASDNNVLPVIELMWGTAGSMLACVLMHELTHEERFEALYGAQATRLLEDLEEFDGCRLWMQDLYGRKTRYAGLVHGFAGNMLAFVRGWRWLTSGQQREIEDVAVGTLTRTAKRSEMGANWPANADVPDAPMLCQICHGAPGVLVGMADAPFTSGEFEQLLVDAGNLVWTAGPLKKGSNFCHGTGGNAYAMLALFKRTGDELWLGRACSFAMHAIAQLRAASQEYGRGRYSLWTGDPGLAVCLWSCIRGEPKFPGLDVM
jgi:hypothetical protein